MRLDLGFGWDRKRETKNKNKQRPSGGCTLTYTYTNHVLLHLLFGVFASLCLCLSLSFSLCVSLIHVSNSNCCCLFFFYGGACGEVVRQNGRFGKWSKKWKFFFFKFFEGSLCLVGRFCHRRNQTYHRINRQAETFLSLLPPISLPPFLERNNNINNNPVCRKNQMKENQ